VFASVIGPFGGFFASGFKRAFKIKVSAFILSTINLAFMYFVFTFDSVLWLYRPRLSLGFHKVMKRASIAEKNHNPLTWVMNIFSAMMGFVYMYLQILLFFFFNAFIRNKICCNCACIFLPGLWWPNSRAWRNHG
jgi:hypothetical protein